MLVNEDEILFADDPQLERISNIHQSLLEKGYPHIALIRKSGDPKIYYKALRSTQELFTIKKICEDKSTDKIKYTVFMSM